MEPVPPERESLLILRTPLFGEGINDRPPPFLRENYNPIAGIGGRTERAKVSRWTVKGAIFLTMASPRIPTSRSCSFFVGTRLSEIVKTL
jgi:hypothetical protein